jgi:hypothetical protein
MPVFKHRQLDLSRKDIRLLRLEKQNDEATPVRLRLCHAVIEETKYFALSYAWGDPAPIRDVVIHDEDGLEYSFSVRQNLYDFFMAARKNVDCESTQTWSTDWIWIDQICINQADLPERNHQVSQMALLYSMAKATIVWPGLMPAIVEDVEEPSESISPWAAPALTQSDRWDFLSNTDRRLLRRLSGSSLHALQASSYWNRLWIIQEIVLASSEIVFMTTESYAFYDILNTTGKMIAAKEKQSSHYNIRLHDWHDRISELTILSSKVHGRWLPVMGNTITWAAVLVHSRNAQCSEPLDIVYSLVGLVHEDLRIFPDYSLTVRQCIRKVVEKEMMFWQARSVRLLWPALWRIYESLTTEGRQESKNGVPLESSDTESLLQLGLTRIQSLCRFLQELNLPVPTAVPRQPHELVVLSVPSTTETTEDELTYIGPVCLSKWDFTTKHFLGIEVPFGV